MKTRTRALASTAAMLFLAGTPPALAEETTEVAKVKCEGVNQCKSHSDCKTFFSDCASKNSCKGKGFRMLTPEECEAAKARLKEQETES